jgi:hypothetical protein
MIFNLLSFKKTSPHLLLAVAALLSLPLVHASGNTVIPAGSHYVAMGSSYAAGPGVGRKDSAGGGCARSLDNYAHQLAAQRGLKLTDASCSGATTDNILTKSQAGFPPQIESVTADTALVTMTIGGNDVGYIGNLLGKSCRDEAAQTGTSRACSFISDASVKQKLAQLPSRLDAVFAAIRQRAPAAIIVVVNYLPVLPETGGCAGIPLTTDDSAALVKTYERLVTIEKDRAQANGAIFIASAHIGRGHDACSSAPFTASYHPPVTSSWTSPAAYHPTISGMTTLAGAIDRALPR